MSHRKFTVIKGGMEATGPRKLRFLSAFGTDTRLMGVVSLSVHWLSEDESGSTEDFHQFFYYDAEEYGLETYKGLMGDDRDALILTEQALMGGLGGNKVQLTEAEFRCLLRQFAAANKILHAPLPEPREDYDFILQEPETLGRDEQDALIYKLCTPLRSDCHLINYFLMRCFAKDKVGMECLTLPGVSAEGIAGPRPATLCKNVIEDHRDEKGRHSYLCEALVESGNRYQLFVLEVAVERGRVASVGKHSAFKVSAAEAAMMLNRAEFVTIYEIMTDPEDFDYRFAALTAGALQTEHDNGRLFLQFNKDNDHVDRRVFRLNEDIYGLYYVSDFGQLFLAAYGEKEIAGLERIIKKSPLSPYLLPAAKYEFKEPVLYDFIQSNFEDFNEYLDTIRS